MLSIRASLIVWFVGLTVALLAVFSVTLYIDIRSTLVSELDERLANRAESLLALCEWEDDGRRVEFELTPELAAEFAAAGRGRGIEVRSVRDGAMVHASGATLGAMALPAVQGRSFTFLDRDGPESIRVCSLRAALRNSDRSTDVPAPEVVVRVAESFAAVRGQLARVRWTIALLALIAALAMSGFSWLLSRRLVRPLDQLGRAAAAVDPRRRVPMPRRGSGDELDRLAEVLDGAFTSLGDALDRQARFTADAAHELRNPVSVIRSAAEVALRGERSAAEQRRFLDDILTTAKRMGDVVQALLTLARVDSVGFRSDAQPVDLLAVVQDSVRGSADGAARVTVRGESESVRGDPGLLRVMVDNLIGNALRHGGGTTVDVSVGREAGNGVVLRVRDFGNGVPPDLRSQVFARFYRGGGAVASDGGAGLGLSIVGEVARVHGARCEVGDADPGACFLVVFPRGPAEPPAD